MLRRFDQFQWGPLNAQRLNEIVDAIVRLQQSVAQMSVPEERTKDVILAVITGPGTSSSSAQERCIPCVSYPFEEVGFVIDGEGEIKAETCVQVERVESGLTSARGAFLVTLESEAKLTPGTVVKAHLATRIAGLTAGDKAMVYIATPLVESAVFNAVITAVLPEDGKYEAGRDSEAESPIFALENIYETSGHYGALDAPQNECASLTPRRLRVGDLVAVWRHDDEYYTVAPTAFDVECLPCDTQALQNAQQAPAPQGADFIAYAMLNGST